MASAVPTAPLPSTASSFCLLAGSPAGLFAVLCRCRGQGQPASLRLGLPAARRFGAPPGLPPLPWPPREFPKPLKFLFSFPAGQPHHVLPVRPQDQQRHHRGAPTGNTGSTACPWHHSATAGSAPAQLLWNQAKCIGCTAPAPPQDYQRHQQDGIQHRDGPHRAGNALAAPKAKNTVATYAPLSQKTAATQPPSKPARYRPSRTASAAFAASPAKVKSAAFRR